IQGIERIRPRSRPWHGWNLSIPWRVLLSLNKTRQFGIMSKWWAWKPGIFHGRSDTRRASTDHAHPGRAGSLGQLAVRQAHAEPGGGRPRIAEARPGGGRILHRRRRAQTRGLRREGKTRPEASVARASLPLGGRSDRAAIRVGGRWSRVHIAPPPPPSAARRPRPPSPP